MRSLFSICLFLLSVLILPVQALQNLFKANDVVKTYKPKLENFETLQEVHDEALFDVAQNLVGTSFYFLSLDRGEGKNNKFQTVDPLNSHAVQHHYKLDFNLTSFYVFFVLPPVPLLRRQLRKANTYQYVLPFTRRNAELQNWKANSSQETVYSWPYSHNHPVQDRGRCVDHTFFGAQGPYWPSHSLFDLNYSLTHPGPVSHPFGKRTALSYKVLYSNYTAQDLLRKNVEVNNLLVRIPWTTDNIHYSSANIRHVTTHYTKKSFFSRGSYLIRGRHGFVHPHGYVYFGNEQYYIGLDGCETRWNRIKREKNVIENRFKVYNYSFSDLFKHYSGREYMNRNLLEGFNISQFVTSPPQANISTLFQGDPAGFYGHFLYTNFYEFGVDFFNSKREQKDPTPENYSGSTPRSDAYIFKVNVLDDALFKVDKVLLITTPWDFNYHHVVADLLGRMVYYYDFLQHNKDVKLHIRMGTYPLENRMQSERHFRYMIYQLMEINPSRLIFGSVLASEVFIPRTLRCSMSFSNSYEIQMVSSLMLKLSIKFLLKNTYKIPNIYGMHGEKDFRDFLKYYYFINNYSKRKEKKSEIEKSGIQPLDGIREDDNTFAITLFPKWLEGAIGHRNSTKNTSKPPSLQSLLKDNSYYEKYHNKRFFVVQQRFGSGDTPRTWPDSLLYKISSYLHKRMNGDETLNPPNGFHVVPLTSNNTDCLACEIIEYSRASLILGAHGAGLTNLMFLRQKSLVVETSGNFQDVHFTTCGYYHNFAKIFGHSHMLYDYLWLQESFNHKYLINELYLFYQALNSKGNSLMFKALEGEDVVLSTQLGRPFSGRGTSLSRFSEEGEHGEPEYLMESFERSDEVIPVMLQTERDNQDKDKLTLSDMLEEREYLDLKSSNNSNPFLTAAKLEMLRKEYIEAELKRNEATPDPAFFMNLFTWYKVSNVTYFSEFHH